MSASDGEEVASVEDLNAWYTWAAKQHPDPAISRRGAASDGDEFDIWRDLTSDQRPEFPLPYRAHVEDNIQKHQERIGEKEPNFVKRLWCRFLSMFINDDFQKLLGVHGSRQNY